jgi:16S rRNA (guanine527-N7)-methyltransferase
VPIRSLNGALEDARSQGLLGRGPIEDQVRHSDAFVQIIQAIVGRSSRPDASTPPSILDLGSGGGIPGLVIAQRLPELALTLLDGSSRRTAWLEEAVAELGWSDRVKVVGQRAELAGRDASWRGSFSVVVARAFAASGVAAECAAAFLRVGGSLVVSEPPAGSPGHEGRWPADGLAKVGFDPAIPVSSDGFQFAEIRLTSPCPDRYPRRVGIPEKRPLF